MSFFDFLHFKNKNHFNPDAWSQGQIRSKLWLVEELEKHLPRDRALNIWVLGAWYNTTAFLLLSRKNLTIQRINSFDLDPEANRIARLVNGAWTFAPEIFYTYQKDCENLSFTSGEYGPQPDVIINTAMEHFSAKWIDRVPSGTTLCLQSTNMPHKEHTHLSPSLAEFGSQLRCFSSLQYVGELAFEYPKLKFDRYMLIGKKS